MRVETPSRRPPTVLRKTFTTSYFCSLCVFESWFLTTAKKKKRKKRKKTGIRGMIREIHDVCKIGNKDYIKFIS